MARQSGTRLAQVPDRFRRALVESGLARPEKISIHGESITELGDFFASNPSLEDVRRETAARQRIIKKQRGG